MRALKKLFNDLVSFLCQSKNNWFINTMINGISADFLSAII